MEGALEWRMVSTTSVERPESMSWAPSEVKPTVSIVLDGGEISSSLLGTEGPSWWGAQEEARREGMLNLWTILCPATAGQWEVVEPSPGELSPGLPGAERSGEKHTDEASAISAPSCPVREDLECLRENQRGQWDVSRDANRSTCAWNELPPYYLHHLGVEPSFPGPQPLSRQDVLLYFWSPGQQDNKRQQLPLGPQEDLARLFLKWTWPQPPLVIYVGDHRCAIWVDKHMVAPEIC